jgi:hypothetical protein
MVRDHSWQVVAISDYTNGHEPSRQHYEFTTTLLRLLRLYYDCSAIYVVAKFLNILKFAPRRKRDYELSRSITTTSTTPPDTPQTMLRSDVVVIRHPIRKGGKGALVLAIKDVVLACSLKIIQRRKR